MQPVSFANFGELDRHYVYKVAPGDQIVFREIGKGGEGDTRFTSSSETLVLKAPKQPPLCWALNNKAFAEGAFLTFNRGFDESCLHIVEMKSRLTADDFCHVMKQFHGMYLAALGIFGVLKIPAPKRVCLYIAYKRLAIEQSQPIFLKNQVGGMPAPGLREWRNSKVTLPDGIVAELVKGERTDGDINFGMV